MAKKVRPAKRRPLTPDFMGRAGQAKFGEMCDRANVVANDSARADRMGWDYLIEVPFDASRGGEPFDKRHKFPDMKAQIKTIWADNNSIDIDLIAAERLARWEYPSFIIILRMNMDKTFRDAFVIHLLGDNLARILKALREAEAQNSRSIKNRILTFNITAGTRVSVDGDEMVTALREAIGSDECGYAARKRDQLNNLGYGIQRVSGRFTIKAKSTDEALNVFLGMQSGRVEEVEADEVRFEIPIPLIRDTDAWIQFKPESKGSCEFVVASRPDYKRAVFPAELYFASLGGPEGPWKLRVVSDLIELVASKEGGEASFSVGINNDGRYTLDERVSMTQFYLIVASGQSTGGIRKQGKTLFSFDIKQQLLRGTPDYLKRELIFMSSLRRVMAEIGLQNMRLSDNEITENIEGIHFILMSDLPNNDVTITFISEWNNQPNRPLVEDLKEGLFASKIEFRGATVAFWAHVRVTASIEDNTVHMTLSNLRLRDISVVEDNEAFNAWVKDASECTGLGLVIQVEKVVQNYVR